MTCYEQAYYQRCTSLFSGLYAAMEQLVTQFATQVSHMYVGVDQTARNTAREWIDDFHRTTVRGYIKCQIACMLSCAVVLWA